jgi:hypothetical protein
MGTPLPEARKIRKRPRDPMMLDTHVAPTICFSMKAHAFWFLIVLATLPLQPYSAEPKEPSFEGKPLSFWLRYTSYIGVDNSGRLSDSEYPEKFQTEAELDNYGKTVASLRAKVPLAIKSMGDKALPFLYEKLRTPGKGRMQFILDKEYNVEFENSGQVIRGQAIRAFTYLKDRQKVIEPELLKIISDPTLKPEVRGASLGALRLLSPETAEKASKLIQPPIQI